jgi:hypothetical protein
MGGDLSQQRAASFSHRTLVEPLQLWTRFPRTDAARSTLITTYSDGANWNCKPFTLPFCDALDYRLESRSPRRHDGAGTKGDRDPYLEASKLAF